MSMLCRYKDFTGAQPVWPLHGRLTRPRPMATVTVIGPGGTHVLRGLIDTGADDTVFEDKVAHLIGLDLTRAPVGGASGVGQVSSPLHYAEVTLRLVGNGELREWPARVGFTAAPLKRALLGFAGFLQFFTATFHGDREEVELTMNGLYPGT
jgi:predicted aspartyl protease